MLKPNAVNAVAPTACSFLSAHVYSFMGNGGRGIETEVLVKPPFLRTAFFGSHAFDEMEPD